MDDAVCHADAVIPSADIDHRAASGAGIDVALGGMPFEASAVARATPYRFVPVNSEPTDQATCGSTAATVVRAISRAAVASSCE